MTEYSHSQHLETQIDRYLRSVPFSEWAGFAIKQEDRRKLAVQWMAKQMRAIMAPPDPPREYTAVEYIKEFARDPYGEGKAQEFLRRAFHEDRDGNIVETDPIITVEGRGYTRKELQEMDQSEFATVMMKHMAEFTGEVLEGSGVVDSPNCSCARFPSTCAIHGPEPAVD